MVLDPSTARTLGSLSHVLKINVVVGPADSMFAKIILCGNITLSSRTSQKLAESYKKTFAKFPSILEQRNVETRDFNDVNDLTQKKRMVYTLSCSFSRSSTYRRSLQR